LQDQPLLLEDLLEQEKREQERQQQAQSIQDAAPVQPEPNPQALLSDMDFERLRADVLRSPTTGGSPGLSPPTMPGDGLPKSLPPPKTNLFFF